MRTRPAKLIVYIRGEPVVIVYADGEVWSRHGTEQRGCKPDLEVGVGSGKGKHGFVMIDDEALPKTPFDIQTLARELEESEG